VRDEHAGERAVVDGRDPITTVDDVDGEPGGLEGGSDGRACRVARHAFQHDAIVLRPLALQDGCEALEQFGHAARGRSARRGEHIGRTREDPPLEFADDPLLPRLGVVEPHGARDTELERALAAPQGRVRRVETEDRHSPIVRTPEDTTPVIHSDAPGHAVRTVCGGADT
jgi:hypothetical protein